MFYQPIFDYEGFTLVQRPDTPHYYAYWRPKGRRVRRMSLGTGDLAEAQRKLIAFADGRRTPTCRAPDRTSVGQVLDGYVEGRLKGKARRDAESIVNQWKTFLDEADLQFVSEVTPGVQREFVEWRRRRAVARIGSELSRGTLNKDLEVLRAALNFWKKEGFVSDVPHVRLLPKPAARDRFLTQDEVGRLLAECHEPHLSRFVMISLHTLQRPGAVLGLRFEQVDLARRRIDFAPPGWVRTNKRRPVVPITDTLMRVLEEARSDSVTGHVIEYLGAPVDSVKKSFAKACSRAGLTNVTPYTLRHTGATLLVAAGAPLWQVSGYLGHGISRTTEIYAKHAPEFLSDASAGLERVLGEAAIGERRAPKMRQTDAV